MENDFEFIEKEWRENVISFSNPSGRQFYNFCFILYPEHFVYNGEVSKMYLVNCLMNLNCAFVLSPLHDRDLKENGEVVKPHYHCMVCYDSKKSFQQVTDDLLSCGIHFNYGINSDTITFDNVVKSKEGTIRYFVHSGWEEKYQYDWNDCVFFNLDKSDVLLSSISVTDACKKITNIIENNMITEYRDLLNILQEKDEVLFLFLVKKLNHTIITYLKSYSRELAKSSSE